MVVVLGACSCQVPPVDSLVFTMRQVCTLLMCLETCSPRAQHISFGHFDPRRKIIPKCPFGFPRMNFREFPALAFSWHSLGKEKKTNKHKEFWRDTPWFVSRLSRGRVPSVPPDYRKKGGGCEGKARHDGRRRAGKMNIWTGSKGQAHNVAL